MVGMLEKCTGNGDNGGKAKVGPLVCFNWALAHLFSKIATFVFPLRPDSAEHAASWLVPVEFSH